MKLSRKQEELRKKIIAQNIPKISVLGSEQSGKTFDICLGTICYAEELHQYDPVKEYYGAIIGWDIETLKGNIGETFERLFDEMHYKKDRDYEMRFGTTDKYLKIKNITFFFFSFNTKLSFNKIQGKPLIFIWIDESARIYSQNSLQEDFDKFPGRQISFSGHPYKKTIHSFNVEGNSHHPYKVKYIDNSDAIKFEFRPYDNPLIDTQEKYDAVVNTYPEGSALREQKIFNRWVVAEGRVFTEINKLKNLEGLHIMQIGIGVDYGNVNPTAFVPIALCYDNIERRYKVVRLGIYYHDSGEDESKPTTAWYVEQEKKFIDYLMKEYPNIPITDNVVDSEAIHYTNALYNAGVDYTLARKGSGSVDTGVQQMQSLFYKKVLYTLEEKTITRFNGDIPEFAMEDIGVIELEGYQYDRQKSISSGQNCYVKASDHCLTGDTLVKTTKGYIPIKELVGTKGQLYAYNGKDIVVKNYDNCRMTQSNVDIYELELENGLKIKGTYDHPILTTKGYKMLGDLKETDKVLYLKSINTIQGKNVKIANVRKVTKVGKADTFNMEVQDVHNFIANGIIVHNSIDAERYLISEWQSQGKLLII